MAVFVLDQHQKPLMPCSEKRARLLLARGRARVHRLIPFTIRLIDREVAQDITLFPEGLVQGISHRYCTLIQRSDGYGYSLRSDSY